MVAGEDGEDAVEAGDFVDEEGQVDELGGSAQGNEVKEALRAGDVSSVVAAKGVWVSLCSPAVWETSISTPSCCL